jgi:hypothetical protein
MAHRIGQRRGFRRGELLPDATETIQPRPGQSR